MNGHWNRIVLLLAIPVLSVCCKGGGKSGPAEEAPASATPAPAPSMVDGIRIDAPSGTVPYFISDTLEIKLSDLYKGARDSIVLYMDNSRLAILHPGCLRYTLAAGRLSAGRHTVRAVSYYADGKESVAHSRFLAGTGAPAVYTYTLLETLPHDPASYTQGLFYKDGSLYEGTGRNGESVLRKNVPATGKSLQTAALDKEFFGEGIALHKDRIYQLTWLNRRCFVYQAETFQKLAEFPYGTEGWGLSVLDDTLVMSDGSHILRFVDPRSFGPLRELEVFNDKGPLNELNELECVDGKIWANVWHTDLLVEINPRSGEVEGLVDLSGLQKKVDARITQDPEYVLNGIAYDPDRKEFYVTGKCWNLMFKIKIQKP